MTEYNILVDFELETTPDSIKHMFTGEIVQHFESIGPNQFQVGLGIHAEDTEEAKFRGRNTVQSVLKSRSITENWIDATVYGPNGVTHE